jgi:hypothetical protein
MTTISSDYFLQTLEDFTFPTDDVCDVSSPKPLLPVKSASSNGFMSMLVDVFEEITIPYSTSTSSMDSSTSQRCNSAMDFSQLQVDSFMSAFQNCVIQQSNSTADINGLQSLQIPGASFIPASVNELIAVYDAFMQNPTAIETD